MDKRISFNWDIHWACNYNCPYCWFYDKWEELRGRNKYHSEENVIRAWENIFERYGKVNISITGGEPFLYPGFKKILERLSELHRVEVITNLSVDLADIAGRLRGRDVAINPSFHPIAADHEVFLERLKGLLEAGLAKTVSIVAWPPLLKDMASYMEYFMKYRGAFEEKGVKPGIQPFNGVYNGKKYPEAYTQQELAAIGRDIGSRGGKEFSTSPGKTKGKACNAGKLYGVIHPDGSVQRCGSIGTHICNVGNIYDESFRLLDEPLPCTSDSCVCNEWAFLLIEGQGSGNK